MEHTSVYSHHSTWRSESSEVSGESVWYRHRVFGWKFCPALGSMLACTVLCARRTLPFRFCFTGTHCIVACLYESDHALISPSSCSSGVSRPAVPFWCLIRIFKGIGGASPVRRSRNEIPTIVFLKRLLLRVVGCNGAHVCIVRAEYLHQVVRAQHLTGSGSPIVGKWSRRRCRRSCTPSTRRVETLGRQGGGGGYS